MKLTEAKLKQLIIETMEEDDSLTDEDLKGWFGLLQGLEQSRYLQALETLELLHDDGDPFLAEKGIVEIEKTSQSTYYTKINRDAGEENVAPEGWDDTQPYGPDYKIIFNDPFKKSEFVELLQSAGLEPGTHFWAPHTSKPPIISFDATEYYVGTEDQQEY
tara:strand:+ start:1685 stop:2167 length:483 start_codon:yes stop_codon:yes gene_type:complete